MMRMTIAGTCLLAVTAASQGAIVWQSTFDTTADGVVDVIDGNLGKAMIGPVTAGRLQITTEDKAGAFNDNDRAGRSVGAVLDGNGSYSGLYEFNFSALNEDQFPQTWEMVGFIGTNVNSTRQQLGVIMRHWKVGLNYFVSMDLVYGEAGAGAQFFDATGVNGYGPFAPTAIFLGTNPFVDDMQLAIGYDGATHVLTAELKDGLGTLISGNSADLDNVLVPTAPNTIQTMYDSLAITDLGWADYVATGAGRQTVWQVNALTLFDDATGAFGNAQNIDGDLNGDGFVGIGDLNIVLGAWNQNVFPPGDGLQGDPSGDGFVGIEDLNFILGNWNAGTPPAANAVPEPASFALLGLGGLTALRRR
jgi:PEP-CTERM motif